MVNYIDDVRSVSDARVAPPSDFAVAPEVWDAVADIALVPSGWLCCPHCRQGVIHVDWNRQLYAYTVDEQRGLVLAHMIQSHGWTREAARNVT